MSIEVTKSFTKPKPRLKRSAKAPATDTHEEVKARLNATEVVVQGTYHTYVALPELDVVIELLTAAQSALAEAAAVTE